MGLLDRFRKKIENAGDDMQRFEFLKRLATQSITFIVDTGEQPLPKSATPEEIAAYLERQARFLDELTAFQPATYSEGSRTILPIFSREEAVQRFTQVDCPLVERRPELLLYPLASIRLKPKRAWQVALMLHGKGCSVLLDPRAVDQRELSERDLKRLAALVEGG